MIGSRRWRSISFWTKGVGTDSRAKPSVMTRGLTSLSQARCWGVRAGAAITVAAPAAMSPLSSATTLFQIGDERRIGVSCQRRRTPSWPIQGRPNGTKTNCPHSYPQFVDKGQPSSFVVYVARNAVAGARHSSGAVCGLAGGGHPRFVVCRRSALETALPEANSFLSRVPTVLQHCRGFLGGTWTP